MNYPSPGFDSPQVKNGVEKIIIEQETEKDLQVDREATAIEKKLFFLLFLNTLVELYMDNRERIISKLEKLYLSEIANPEVENIINQVINKIEDGYFDFTVILSELLPDIQSLNMKDIEILELIRFCRIYTFDGEDLQFIQERINQIRTNLIQARSQVVNQGLGNVLMEDLFTNFRRGEA